MTREHLLWLKAGESKNFDDAKGFRAEALYEGPNKAELWIGRDEIGLLTGPELSATVEALDRCLLRLPTGITLTVVSDLQGLVGAFSGDRWFDGWEAQNFKDRPKVIPISGVHFP